MQKFASTSFVLAAALALATPAHAGTSNAYEISPFPTAPVTTLQDNITYSRPSSGNIPANETQVGFIVGNQATGLLLRQVSGNSINRVTLTIEASVTDPQETLTLRQPDVYLANLPKECSWDNLPANPKRITCFFRKTTPGFTFPSFVVFYNAPAKVDGNGVGDTAGSDTISTKVRIQYAEGLNGADPSLDNSWQEAVQTLVTLGTVDPINIKSAVAKGGARIYTGDGGVPKNVDNLRQTELASVPTLPALYTVAQVFVTKAKDTDTTLEGANCLTAGNFKECPTYQTTIADPFTLAETRFLTAPLTLVYRIDASNLKRSLNQILSNTLIRYTGAKTDAGGNTVGAWTDQLVGACATGGVPRTDGLPCISSAQCFKNLSATSNAFGAVGRDPDLVGDCEWVLINNGNGLIKIQ